MQPERFSWINKPLLAAMAEPGSVEDLHWLRQQGIDVLISLTEEPPPRHWINEAGLLLLHLPITDMEAPTQEQIDNCLATIDRANTTGLGAAIHCRAGLGRTGTMLACYFVSRGLSAQNAIARVQRLRPGSVETEDQSKAVYQFASRQKKNG